MTRKEALLAISGGALASCSRPSNGRLIRVSAFPGGSANSVYLAQEAGYFAREGLDVEIRLTTNTPQNVPLLGRGRLDVGLGALNPALLNGVAAGLKVRIVGVLDVASPRCGGTGTLYGRRSLFPNGLSDLRQLRGRRIAISSRTGITGFFLESLLNSAGMNSSEVQVLEVSQSEAVAALVGGGLDATVCSHREMELDRFSAKIVRGPSVGEVYPDLQYSFAVFGPTLLSGSPEAGIRFLAAFLRGARDQRAGKVPQILSGGTREGDETTAMSAELCHWNEIDGSAIDLASIGRFVAWAERSGYSPKRVEPAELIDARFWGEAQRRSRRDS